MTMYNNNSNYQAQAQQPAEKALGWNDTLWQDAQEYILLEDGEYDFIVDGFERGQYDGGENISACPVAVLKIRIDTPKGPAIITHRLLLHSKMEWKLSEFFTSIGLKKKDQPLRMDWNRVTGSRGRCKVGKREYKDNTYNDIKRFLPADGWDQSTLTGTTGFTPGAF